MRLCYLVSRHIVNTEIQFCSKIIYVGVGKRECRGEMIRYMNCSPSVSIWGTLTDGVILSFVIILPGQQCLLIKYIKGKNFEDRKQIFNENYASK